MDELKQSRHRPPLPLDRPRQLVIALPPMRSHVDVSRIARAAGCFGVRRIIACGNAKLDPKIAREATTQVKLELRRSLLPVLKTLRDEAYSLVGLEQANGSVPVYEFAFPRKTALIIGNERLGIESNILSELNHIVEIPTHGLPYSHNAATAAAIAMYEYCRQYPLG